MAEPITPNDLAQEYGLKPIQVRQVLRKVRPGSHLHGARWHLSASEADSIRPELERIRRRSTT
jgi:hypothetical protein